MFGLVKEDIMRLNEEIRGLNEEKLNDLEENAKFVRNLTGNIKKEIFKEIDRLNDALSVLSKEFSET